jgi:hypothetical protein
MGYVLIGAAGLVLLFIGLRWFTRADPATVATALKITAIVLAVAGVVLLVLVGRIGFVLMLAGVLVPLFMRWRNARRLAGMGTGRAPDPTQGGSSHVDTAYFAMTLDHESGALDGEVRKGPQRGQLLSALDLPALLALLSQCSDDTASQQVLGAYLDRHHEGWRETAASGADGHAAYGGGAQAALTRDEAFRILGLDPDADAAAIKAAHHRLMKKFHPDQGGSAWFAARINEARDLLLGP